MRQKKLAGFLILFLLADITGCQRYGEREKNGEEMQVVKQEILEDSKEIAKGCSRIVKQAEKEKAADGFELQQDVIAYMGLKGYIAVDTENQIDMVNYEKAEAFCKAACEGKKAETAIFLVTEAGGFIRYDLRADNGELKVLASSLPPENETSREAYFESFTACSWKYTEKGYLFFEQYHKDGFDGAPGQTAIRIKPLDGKLRRLNQKYVLPAGYRGSRLLAAEWDETDYSALDFYDLYEVMYVMKYGEDVPYADEYARIEYEIPEKDFEGVIQTYLNVSGSLLKEQAVYRADSRTYRYRTRGLYDSPTPYEPYPEVTGCEEQKDGSLKLTVEAVWARENSDCALVSELMVRPLKKGRFQYVSNRVVTVSGSIGKSWYTPRLTDEEWERLTD